MRGEATEEDRQHSDKSVLKLIISPWPPFCKCANYQAAFCGTAYFSFSKLQNAHRCKYIKVCMFGERDIFLTEFIFKCLNPKLVKQIIHTLTIIK